MQNYEVEVKTLLGSAENAEALRIKLKELDPESKLIAEGKQLNHYFVDGNLETLVDPLSKQFSPEIITKFKDIAARGKNVSIRTRQKDDTVLFVVKASVDDTTSSNGILRMEFEEKVPLTLSELDQMLLSAGFAYQAKWSREREEYMCKGVTVCLDRNAGYGWLAEFEKVVGHSSELESAQTEVRALMQACGVEELAQDRLERMFAHYNANWAEYYGTEKIFTIE